MGVPKEVFMNLEIDMIMHHFNSLMDEEEAARLLSENLSPVFPFNALQKSGIVLTSDPFFRSLLLAYFKSFAGIENIIYSNVILLVFLSLDTFDSALLCF